MQQKSTRPFSYTLAILNIVCKRNFTFIKQFEIAPPAGIALSGTL